MKIPSFGPRKEVSHAAPAGRGVEAAKPTVSSVMAVQGEIVDSYPVPADAPEDARAKVYIVEKDNFASCLVKYPELTPEQAEALRVLKENLEYYFPSHSVFNTEQMITGYLWKTAEEVGILGVVQVASEKLRYYLLRDAIGFGELDALFNDDNLEEVSCVAWNKPVRVYHRRYTQHRYMETNVTFGSEEALQRFVRRMAQLAGRSISRAQPSVEGTLSFGAVEKRITATLANEISRPGSTFTVRKQKENPLTVTQLSAPEPARPYPAKIQPVAAGPVEYEEEHRHKTMTALMTAYFWSLMEWKTNILICGEPSAGKTTLLNSLLALTNPNAKVVTCEDTAEILLPDNLHWERLVTRHAQAGVSPLAQRFEVDLASLLKLSLRFSPTILSLGEMRGEESESVANAMTIGYSTICTVHAASTRDCITRITTSPMRFVPGHVRDISAIVTMRRVKLPDGREVRRVSNVDEVVPNEVDHNAYEVRNIFQYRPEGDSFTPTTPEEVLERSYRIRKAGEYFGWSNEHMLASLTGRAGYLTDAIREGVFGINQLSEKVRSYYAKEYLKELQRAPQETVDPQNSGQDTSGGQE